MGLDEETVKKRTEDCIAMLKLEAFRDRQPYHLSGGEKKKVAIASVLSMNPEVLVLDEPMNGLDPKTERWLAGFLVSLNKVGKTLIVSTHNLELVQEISKRAVLFDTTHEIAADLKTPELLSSTELLKRVGLVDRFYHKHDDAGHSHSTCTTTNTLGGIHSPQIHCIRLDAKGRAQGAGICIYSRNEFP